MREKREELEEDKPQVGSNSSWSHPNLSFSYNGLWVVFILSVINIIDIKSLTPTCFCYNLNQAVFFYNDFSKLHPHCTEI